MVYAAGRFGVKGERSKGVADFLTGLFIFNFLKQSALVEGVVYNWWEIMMNYT